MKTNFYTLGVYGYNSEQFFEILQLNKIDTFIDIRRRRAVRGSKYSFANSNRLQVRLKELAIKYIHILDLSPTNEIRAYQKIADKKNDITKLDRQKLDNQFIEKYKENVLDSYNFDDLFKQLESFQTERALLFCVESEPTACHRSIVAERLEKVYSLKISHL